MSRDSAPVVFEALDGRLIHPRRPLVDAWRFRTLLSYWVRRNLVARYRQTTLGPIWVVLVPMLSSLVYAFVFSLLLRVETGAVPYTLFAMTNLALWMYTTRAIQTGPAALLGNLDLITRVRFPREFLPISVWLESLVDLIIALSIVGVFAIWYGVTPTRFVALAPIVLAIHSMLTVGLMLLVAAVSIRVRDLTYILPISLQLALYLAPILYPLELIPARVARVVSAQSGRDDLRGLSRDALSGPLHAREGADGLRRRLAGDARRGLSPVQVAGVAAGGSALTSCRQSP